MPRLRLKALQNEGIFLDFEKANGGNLAFVMRSIYQDPSLA